LFLLVQNALSSLSWTRSKSYKKGESTYSLLGELTGTLILGVLDQLHDAALVGSKASDLTDEGADEDDALASLSSFSSEGGRRGGVESGEFSADLDLCFS
jgi:hypothetical protein